ncbi:hypothetical protein B0H10DRAFT_1949585 [Mycena sp. CBHHK59/15]|nr:hypothetical protein B0H10DRAFT_1949585 [Mycena sp. CBHHK59/15]
MASSACQCGNPLACVCFAQTPCRNDFCFDQYSTPNPQNTWQNSYVQPLPQAFMTPAPAFNRAPPFNPTPAFTQMPGFNSPPAFNTTQSIPQPLSWQHTSPAAFSMAVPPPSRAPFVDVTNTINSAAPPASRQRKKRKAPTGSESSPSRRRVDPAPTGPAVFGVGPSTASAAAAAASDYVSHPSLPSANLGSLVNKPATSGAAATDVWFFIRGVDTPVAPEKLPEPQPSDMEETRLDKKVFPYLACRFCPVEKWTTWKNVEGQTASIRHHLETVHGRVWREIVYHRHLKGWETIGTSPTLAPGEREEFSLPVFYEKLAKWIAVDDQFFFSLLML